MKTIEASKISALLEYFDALSYDTLNDDELHERYDDMLDECQPIEVNNFSLSYAQAMKEQDPTMYRCGFSDWLDAALSDSNLF